jgi:4-alpha-glucanotransferase
MGCLAWYASFYAPNSSFLIPDSSFGAALSFDPKSHQVPMTIRFSLPYRTVPGQRLAVCGSLPELGSWQLAGAALMHYDEATTCWSLDLEASAAAGVLTYKYVLLDANTGGQHWEYGPNRTVAYDPARAQAVRLADYWRAPAQPENEL